MSPVHAQYLKNSGVASSFSVSIIIDDHLWGLVTCQNIKPKHIDLEDRVQAGIFTALAANAYSSFKSKSELNYRLELNEKLSQLKTKFLKHNHLSDSLIESKTELKNLPEADGLAIVSDENIVTAGTTPDSGSMDRIIKWALANTKDRIYVSRNFLKDHGKELNLSDDAAGIIIYFIERDKNEMLIWFRKEFDEHINWAGSPENSKCVLSERRRKTDGIAKNFFPHFYRKYQRTFQKMEFKKYQCRSGSKGSDFRDLP